VRAVKGKSGVLRLIGSAEAHLYRRIQASGSLNEDSLSTRERHLAEGMYIQNVLILETSEDGLVYSVY